MRLQATTRDGEQISREDAVQLVSRWIKTRTPSALVRFLEGEARLLYAEPGKSDRVREACNKLRRQTGLRFRVKEMLEVREWLLHALDSCDVAAIAGNERFPPEHTMWVTRVEKIFAERAPLRSRPVFVTEGVVNRDLLAALPTLVADAPLVSAISCRNVRPVLESYGCSDVRVFQIPSQHVKRAIDDEYEVALHDVPIYPNFIKDLEARITVRTPGELFLVGAGLFGKHLCIKIRELGGIAVDIGSAMDTMVGKPTRGKRWLAFMTQRKAAPDADAPRTGPMHSAMQKVQPVLQKIGSVARTKGAAKSEADRKLMVRRPIGSWAREIQETGIVLSAENPEKFTQYVVFENNIVAQLLPASDGWSLGEVEPRDKAVIAGRYEGRKLIFAPAPLKMLAKRAAEEPPQTIEVSRIKLVYKGSDGAALSKMKGQVRGGDWDLDVAPREPRSLSHAGSHDDRLKVGISRQGRYIVIGDFSPLTNAEQAGKTTIDATVVVRHPNWEKFRESCIAFAGERKGLLYQRVNHPDLIDLQAGHDDDRPPILKKALQSISPAGKRLLDIGAHWGQISRLMEELGFEVTAVEHSPSGAKVARILREATESRYEIWEGSIFEFPDIERQDVILGLNIFHHFLKRKETFDGLVSLLNRSKAEIIIFTAHVYGRGPDFIGAYKDFPPDEFAAFISKESGLHKIEHVGTTHDGRRMYKLSR